MRRVLKGKNLIFCNKIIISVLATRRLSKMKNEFLG